MIDWLTRSNFASASSSLCLAFFFLRRLPRLDLLFLFLDHDVADSAALAVAFAAASAAASAVASATSESSSSASTSLWNEGGWVMCRSNRLID